jgi:hypothetical protein
MDGKPPIYRLDDFVNGDIRNAPAVETTSPLVQTPALFDA